MPQDHQDLKGSKETMVPKVQLDSVEAKGTEGRPGAVDPRVREVSRGLRELLESQDPVGPKEQLELKEPRGRWVPQAQRQRQDRKETLVNLEPMDVQDLMDIQETQDTQDLKALRDTPDPGANQGQWGHLDLQEPPDLQASPSTTFRQMSRSRQ